MMDFSNLNSLVAQNTHVVELRIRADGRTGKYDLFLELAESSHSSARISVVFRDVAELTCNLDLAGWSQVHMLGIREVRHGHERPYVVEEIEYQSLRFVCQDASFV
jgi:hypothetical protein